LGALALLVVNALGGLGMMAWGLRGLRRDEAMDRQWTLQHARWQGQDRAWPRPVGGAPGAATGRRGPLTSPGEVAHTCPRRPHPRGLGRRRRGACWRRSRAGGHSRHPSPMAPRHGGLGTVECPWLPLKRGLSHRRR
jgi:hypothetical protein